MTTERFEMRIDSELLDRLDHWRNSEDDTACHLDLVQWATSPVWRLLDQKVRQALFNQDKAFLEEQLQAEQIEYLLVNGSGVWRPFSNAFASALHIKEIDPVNGHSAQTCRVWTGTYRSTVKIIAWSTNIQSSHGVKGSIAPAICSRVSGNR